ncbi:hypothetical protein NDU88_006577, partial [Pleurodeles waltl]
GAGPLLHSSGAQDPGHLSTLGLWLRTEGRHSLQLLCRGKRRRELLGTGCAVLGSSSA